MDNSKNKDARLQQTKKLAHLLSAANVSDPVQTGKCEWTDDDGNDHCSNWTEFQCSQFGGQFTPGEQC